MKSNWVIKTLGEICDKASSNVSQNQLDNENGDYPIFGASGFIKNISFFHQDKPYISIVKDGAGIGRITLQPANSSVIGTLQYLIPKESIDIHYLYYFLLSIDFNKHKNGATIPHIYFKDYSQENILVPPLPEQKHIVEIIDKSFESVKKAKENAEQNLTNAKEIFESYLESIFENGGADWEEKKLGEIANFEYGFTDKAKDDGDFRYVRITDTDKDGNLTTTDKVYLKSSKEAIKFIIQDKDLLMARVGASFARVLFYKDFEPSIFASYLIRIKFKDKFENKLYWYFSKSRNYWKQAKKLSSGSAQPQFNANALDKIIFKLPKSITEQQSIVKKLDALSAETKKLEEIYQHKLNDLEELKKAILQKAFNGELTKD